jgi:hypothetical protein
LILLLASMAYAGIDEKCIDKVPSDYSEQVQVDFLQNSIALAATYSPIHGPVPDFTPGSGSAGLDLNVVPPLPCKRRFALNATKTEDTNKSPVIPRPRVSGVIGVADGIALYSSLAWLPPIPILGQRSNILSAEGGVSFMLKNGHAVSPRVHVTAMKTVTDAATAFDPDRAPALDLFLANTFGLDFIYGYTVEQLHMVPFVSLGITDVSTVFWIGDDGVMANNMHPYIGPVASAGIDGFIKRFRYGLEFYAAPGGHSRPNKDFANERGFGGYGRLYTARLRVGVGFP